MKNVGYLVWYMPATKPGELDGKGCLWGVRSTEEKANETVEMIKNEGYGIDAHWTDETVD